jgi:hypothetical protein
MVAQPAMPRSSGRRASLDEPPHASPGVVGLLLELGLLSIEEAVGRVRFDDDLVL